MSSDARVVVGRDRELAQVREFLARAPGVLLLEGEAGIGKTALLHACVDAARASSWRVLLARPAEAEAAFTFAGSVISCVTRWGALDRLPPPQRRALAVALLLESRVKGTINSCRVSGGCFVVLVNEAAEPVATVDLASRWLRLRFGRPEFERAMRPLVVVVLEVDDGLRRRLPIYPGKLYEDWDVDDPAEKSLEDVRVIRDAIDKRVRQLLAKVSAEPVGSATD